jgi:D-alanyl-D-alanine carboxypeptidase/D-alanyl-D-alanine-endopeptidase (penicillin-binding protein 4)
VVKKSFVLLLLVIFLPVRVQNTTTGHALTGKAVAAPVVSERSLNAVSGYEEALLARGEKLDDQGILIESLDGHQVLAQENADTPFNPASVMKLSTTLAAISKFGPDYRFRTNFLAAGKIDFPAARLAGDLVVEGTCDPMFSALDAEQVSRELVRMGISRVTGSLRIAGQFTFFATGYRENLSAQTSAEKLKTALSRGGVRIEGGIVFADKSGSLLVSHYSEQLIRILLFQNAHSSNAIAEVVGQAVGGPVAIQNFLIQNLGLAEQDVFVGRASGLEFNRITPRASLKVLRGLIAVLAKYSLKLENVMPVAGVDSGTLRGRFSTDGFQGAIIAKTGTLISLDGGVSTLVGIASTKDGGPLLFAIFDSDGNIHDYRRLQDQFLEDAVVEEGGPAPVWRVEDELADYVGNSIVQVFSANKPQPAERAAD